MLPLINLNLLIINLFEVFNCFVYYITIFAWLVEKCLRNNNLLYESDYFKAINFPSERFCIKSIILRKSILDLKR